MAPRKQPKSVMVFGPGADGFAEKLERAYQSERSSVRPRIAIGNDGLADYDLALWSGDGLTAIIAAPRSLTDLRVDLTYEHVPAALVEATA